MRAAQGVHSLPEHCPIPTEAACRTRSVSHPSVHVHGHGALIHWLVRTADRGCRSVLDFVARHELPDETTRLRTAWSVTSSDVDFGEESAPQKCVSCCCNDAGCYWRRSLFWRQKERVIPLWQHGACGNLDQEPTTDTALVQRLDSAQQPCTEACGSRAVLVATLGMLPQPAPLHLKVKNSKGRKWLVRHVSRAQQIAVPPQL